MNEEEQPVRIAEAAKRLYIPKRVVYDAIARGHITAANFGADKGRSQYRIRLSDLRKYLAEQAAKKEPNE